MGFAIVPDWAQERFLEIGYHEWAVFMRICRFRCKNKPFIELSRAEISEFTGIKLPHISKAVASLKSKGWITEISRSEWAISDGDLVTKNVTNDVTESVSKGYEKRNKRLRNPSFLVTESVTSLYKDNKSIKNNKNIESSEPEGSPVSKEPTDVEKVFSYWQTRFNRQKSILDNKRRSKIQLGLKHFTVEDLFKAVDAAAVDDWTLGHNPRGKKYDDLVTIFRDVPKIESWLQEKVSVTNGVQNNGYKSKQEQSNDNARKTFEFIGRLKAGASDGTNLQGADGSRVGIDSSGTAPDIRGYLA